ARTCRQLALLLKPTPAPVPRPESSWLPCANQPVIPDSKSELEIKFGPVAPNTSTLSTRHSPGPSRMICSESAGPLPLSSTPVNWMFVHPLLLVSSLSAQLGARRRSLRASINSKLLPPP